LRGMGVNLISVNNQKPVNTKSAYQQTPA